MVHRLLRLGVKQFASGSVPSFCRNCAVLGTGLHISLYMFSDCEPPLNESGLKRYNR